MKITNRILFMTIVAMTLNLIAFSQSTQDSVDNRDVRDRQELYQRFTVKYELTRTLTKSDPKLEKPENKKAYDQASKEAFDYAREYVKRYPSDVGPQMELLKKYIKNYEKFEKESGNGQINQLIAAKKYDQAFELGKKVLAENPNDLMTLSLLVNAGILSGQTDSDTNDAATIQYARKAISLAEAGETVTGKSKEELLGMLYYAIGLSSLKTSPDDSARAFIQVATIPSALQKTPQTFYYLALSYQLGEYGKLINSFKSACSTKELMSTPTCKTNQENLDKVIDRMIDANARAVSLSGVNLEFAGIKAEAMKNLPGFYKYRHNGSEEGLNEFIASVITKPLP